MAPDCVIVSSMEFCVLIEPHNGASYLDQLRVAQCAEALGFTGFFRSDHLVAGDGDGLPGPTDTWVTLAGLSRETENIRLGSLMTSATFRHPSVLAVTVAQVDEMSDGRVEFGFGAGWWEREHAATGIDLFAPTERFDRFEEQLEIIDGLWKTPVGSAYSHAGAHFKLIDAPGLPKPVQAHIPVIIGGDGKRRTPAIAARWADEFNSGWDDPVNTAATFTRVKAACEAIGRDPQTLRLSTVQTLCAGASEADLARRAEAIGSSYEDLGSALIGNGDQLHEQIAAFAEVGVERIYVEINDLADLDHLEFFATEVFHLNTLES